MRLACAAASTLLAVGLQSCESDIGSHTDVRSLSFEYLTKATDPQAAVNLSEYARPTDALPPSNHFSGRLVLSANDLSLHTEMLTDEYGLASESGRPGLNTLPDFAFAFVQSDDRLIPLQNGPVQNEHLWWEFVLSPGYVWDDLRDNGFTRAALPVALKQRNEDCVHNGLISFLFNDSGEVSNAAFQVSNQTCMYLQFEMQGLLGAEYDAFDIPDAATLAQRLTAHSSNKIPTRPISELSVDYAGSNPDEFGSIEEISPADMTAYGFLIDGNHYVGGCSTPHGMYPYCDELALPSYSTAKSFVAGLGLMLVEKEYPGTADSLIVDYVSACGEDWHGVTIEHALDMATGHYGSAELHVDEDGAVQSRFFTSEQHVDKVDYACNAYPRQSAPGKLFVYRSWDTYLAGTAINNRLRSVLNEDTDYIDDFLVLKLWEPLNLSELIKNSRRTRDSSRQPFSAYGITMLRDDVAKLMRLVGEYDGYIGDNRPFDDDLFDAIKQRLPDDSGLPAELDTIYYNNGFRSFDVAAYLGCESAVWLITMSGYGGINFVIMPNNTAYYYFSDGGVHRYLRAVRESHRIKPMCVTI